MKAFFYPVLDLFIYGSINISIAAACINLEAFYFLKVQPDWVYIIFIFFSTMVIYSLHKIIGIRMIDQRSITKRFRIVKKYRWHMLLYAGISTMICLFLLAKMDVATILLLLPVGMISILYVTPLLKSKRIRDFNFVKIFVIAFVWMYLSVVIPVATNQIQFSGAIFFLAMEKFIFILAITIPFDVRDLQVDQYKNIKTLATKLGTEKAYRLSYILMAAAWISAIVYSVLLELGSGQIVLFTLVYSFIIWLLYFTKSKSSDYYFSGVLDGAIFLRSFILIFPFII